MSRATTLGLACWLSAAFGLAVGGCRSSANLGANRDGGASASSVSSDERCPAACYKAIGCGLVPDDAFDPCMSVCARATIEDLDCVENNGCSTLRSSCDILARAELEEPESNCLSSCDRMMFWQCATAEVHAQCREACTTAPEAARSTFVGCVRSSGSDCSTMTGCHEVFTR